MKKLKKRKKLDAKRKKSAKKPYLVKVKREIPDQNYGSSQGISEMVGKVN